VDAGKASRCEPGAIRQACQDPAVPERLADVFPLVLAVVLPLAGVLLALQNLVAGDRRQAARLLAATLLGAFLYVLIFTG
jgi:hypothetical protein